MSEEGLDGFEAVVGGVYGPDVDEGREGDGFVAGSDILVCHFVGYCMFNCSYIGGSNGSM